MQKPYVALERDAYDVYWRPKTFAKKSIVKDNHNKWKGVLMHLHNLLRPVEAPVTERLQSTSCDISSVGTLFFHVRDNPSRFVRRR